MADVRTPAESILGAEDAARSFQPPTDVALRLRDRTRPAALARRGDVVTTGTVTRAVPIGRRDMDEPHLGPRSAGDHARVPPKLAIAIQASAGQDTAMQCNICGGAAFTDMPKRPNVRCADCGSLERTRVAALHVTEHLRPPPGSHILHFAPERGLSALLRTIGGPNYRALDIDPVRYPGIAVERFDLCRDVFDLPLDHYDLIVHNHVLEHVECNYTVVLLRLARSLTDDGTMLFSLPILPGEFNDAIVDAPMEEKERRFGPMLHVRRFGIPSLQRTLGMIFPIPEAYDLRQEFGEAKLSDANIPAHHWTQYSGASVFRVRKRDLRC